MHASNAIEVVAGCEHALVVLPLNALHLASDDVEVYQLFPDGIASGKI